MLVAVLKKIKLPNQVFYHMLSTATVPLPHSLTKGGAHLAILGLDKKPPQMPPDNKSGKIES